MKKVMASAGLLALGAFMVQNADAQSASGDKPWTISGSLRGFYDDNYNLQGNGPNRRDTFGFEVRPSISYFLDLDNTTFDVSYTYSMRYYDDRPKNKADHSHDFYAFAKHDFNSNVSIDLTENFVIAQEPTILDPSLASVQRANGNNIHNNAAVSFHDKFTDTLGIAVGYVNNYFDYEETTADVPPGSLRVSRSAALDRIEHTVTLDGRYTFSPQTTGILGYQFGAVDNQSSEPISLPGALVVVPSSLRDNYSHYVYVGADHAVSRLLNLSARVGVQITDYYNDPSTSTSVGPYADVSATYSYTDTGSVTLGFKHTRNQTDLTGATGGALPGRITQDQESSTLYGTVTQKITPDLIARANGQAQFSDFNGGGLSGFQDKYYLVGLSLTYKFTKYVSGEFGYNYDQVESNISGRGFDRNRLYIGVNASY